MLIRSSVGVLLLAAAAAASAEDAQSLIAKNLEARGGAAAVAAIKSVKFEGRQIFPGDFEVTYAEWRTVSPNPRGRIVQSFQGLDFINAYNGSKAWKIDPSQGRKDPETMSADETRQLADGALIGGPLLAAAKDGSTVTYLGREDFDGTDTYKLKVSQKDGDEFVYLLDPDTYLEIKVEERRKIRGAEQLYQSELGDYEKVDGVYFPMAIESWQNSQSNQRARTIITRAAANVPITDDLFDEPGAPAKPATVVKGN